MKKYLAALAIATSSISAIAQQPPPLNGFVIYRGLNGQYPDAFNFASGYVMAVTQAEIGRSFCPVGGEATGDYAMRIVYYSIPQILDEASRVQLAKPAYAFVRDALAKAHPCKTRKVL